MDTEKRAYLEAEETVAEVAVELWRGSMPSLDLRGRGSSVEPVEPRRIPSVELLLEVTLAELAEPILHAQNN